MNIESILNAMKLIGAATPAFKALLDAAMVLFSENDQQKLQQAYVVARQKSDEAHKELQELTEKK